MVRKQIYIDPGQERLLKRKASQLHVSESELIRDGIEKMLKTGKALRRDIEAWETEKKFIRSLVKKGATTGKRTWKREDAFS